jgi:SWI/SNF-related matrix-associated actin-dependent regulator 1 of chromatin subfamily A
MNIATLVDNRIAIIFPFDLRLIEIIKVNIPDRQWNLPSHKGLWSVPMSPFHCAKVIEVLTPLGFSIDPEIEKCADAKAKRPNLRKRLPKNLYPYQAEAVEFIQAARGRMILGDAPGVGKSAPALVWTTLFSAEAERTLIVAPANVIWKWAEKEVAMWVPGRSVQVLEGSKTPINNSHITIMSYRTMVLRYEELKLLPFDTMIFDEAHYLKSNKSQQNRVARKLVKTVPYLLFLTGTAFKNKRIEMFQLLHMLDPKQWSNIKDFGERYCGGKLEGGGWVIKPDKETNTEELQERLAPIMLRRTKMQVAYDLPDLTRVSIPITLDNAKDYEQTLRSVKEQARNEGYKPARALTLLNTLRQVVGMGKTQAAIELAQDLLESGEQIVIHVHHKAVLEAVYGGLIKFVSGNDISVIDGSTPPKLRQAQANAFLGGQRRVMVISSAGKEGIDLYSANQIIFVERQWTPADEEQIEARLHRIGQKNPVTAHYLVAKDTVDERLDEIVRTKRSEFANLIESDIIREVYMELVD